VGGRPDHSNKAMLSNFSRTMSMGPHFRTIVTNKLAKCVKDYVSTKFQLNIVN